MNKIKQFINQEFEKWEMWLYFAILPSLLALSAFIGGVIGTIYQ